MNKSILFLILSVCVVTLFARSSDSTKIIFSKDTILTQDIEIPTGSTLLINPGVTVRLEGYRAIVVRGLIIAQGTAKEPVVFTSVDRVHGSLAQPSWSGVEIRGSDANGQFKHCVFEGAFRNMVWEAKPLFDSCEFVGNHYGLYCTKKAVPHIQNCRFHLNTYAIAADFASPIIAGNLITKNVIGLYLQQNSKAIIGRNIIAENETGIKSEEALGGNQNSLSIQYMWDVMQQLY